MSFYTIPIIPIWMLFLQLNSNFRDCIFFQLSRNPVFATAIINLSSFQFNMVVISHLRNFNSTLNLHVNFRNILDGEAKITSQKTRNFKTRFQKIFGQSTLIKNHMISVGASPSLLIYLLIICNSSLKTRTLQKRQLERPGSLPKPYAHENNF